MENDLNSNYNFALKPGCETLLVETSNIIPLKPSIEESVEGISNIIRLKPSIEESVGETSNIIPAEPIDVFQSSILIPKTKLPDINYSSINSELGVIRPKQKIVETSHEIKATPPPVTNPEALSAKSQIPKEEPQVAQKVSELPAQIALENHIAKTPANRKSIPFQRAIIRYQNPANNSSQFRVPYSTQPRDKTVKWLMNEVSQRYNERHSKTLPKFELHDSDGNILDPTELLILALDDSAELQLRLV